MTRDALITRFLDQAGWGMAARRPLAGDASNRRYERLSRESQRAVLMDAPYDPPPPPAPPYIATAPGPFLKLSAALAQAGYGAPKVLAADEAAGLILLEDLGDAIYARVLEGAPELEHTLYAAAVDLLADLHATPDLVAAPPYDLETMMIELRLLLDWYLPLQGAPASAAARADFEALCAELFAPVDRRDVLVLRDFHAENLLWLPDREGHARVGLLDYQDALIGHRAYDLVSLLEDARRDTTPALQEDMLARYIAATGQDDAQFRADYARLGAQRNIKILGIFARLSERDGKPHYLALLPRVWAHVQHDLSHPVLAPLKDWFGRYVPAPKDRA
ncbi:hypothetical protein FHS89_000039 [Rubricella aquisinus]|uniref:Aminoglycoside phosphotransferase domain-containing protein n=1 Tax=Rubricella aquisinus TaxID=2028108 RepID=A0A840WHU0_9RHOB|nr:phosphotransferase [Rubricella aquisinus]MBB5514041.1 hypothetical protein [Rubricella aquisinus]